MGGIYAADLRIFNPSLLAWIAWRVSTQLKAPVTY